MKKLTEQEYLDELYQGTGILHFMGGSSSKNGREILLLNEGAFLFNEEEIGKEDWNFYSLEMHRQGEEYYSSIVF